MLRRDTQCVESVLPVRQPSLNPTSYLCTLTALICWAVLVGCFNLPTFLLFPPGNGLYWLLTPQADMCVSPDTMASHQKESTNQHTHTRTCGDWLVVWQPWQRCDCCGLLSEHYLHRWTRNWSCCRCGGGVLDGACNTLSVTSRQLANEELLHTVEGLISAELHSPKVLGMIPGIAELVCVYNASF